MYMYIYYGKAHRPLPNLCTINNLYTVKTRKPVTIGATDARIPVSDALLIATIW